MRDLTPKPSGQWRSLSPDSAWNRLEIACEAINGADVSAADPRAQPRAQPELRIRSAVELQFRPAHDRQCSQASFQSRQTGSPRQSQLAPGQRRQTLAASLRLAPETLWSQNR